MFKNKQGFSDVIVMTVMGGILGSLFILGVFVWKEVEIFNTTNDVKQLFNKVVDVGKEDSIEDDEDKNDGNYDIRDEIKHYNFEIKDLDEGSIDRYFNENNFVLQNKGICRVKRILYRDLNGDKIREAIVEFDADAYGCKDYALIDRFKIVKNVYAGGWPTVSIFGVFQYQEDTGFWTPIFMDVLKIPVYAAPVDDDKPKSTTNKMDGLLNINIITDSYGQGYNQDTFITEILFEKAYCGPDSYCKYKLIFTNLEYEMEILDDL